jgi:hypothetical protein
MLHVGSWSSKLLYMAKSPPRSPALRAALKLFGNPYYSLQIEGDVVELEDEFRQPTKEEVEYIQRQGNQYAKLSITVLPREVDAAVVPHAPTSVSKKEFESECARVLRQYIPEAQHGRLRDHHRAFIARNASRPPKVRHELLAQIKKYDLSGIAGFQGRFNRENDQLTDEKLQQLERKIVGSDQE